MKVSAHISSQHYTHSSIATRKLATLTRVGKNQSNHSVKINCLYGIYPKDYMQLLLVNYVLCILYISKIYYKVMYA